MFEKLIDLLPRGAKAPALGAVLLLAFVSSVYAISTYAAEQKVAPVRSMAEGHEENDRRYLHPLLEAIWADSRALCAANPKAKCDGYDPTRSIPK